MAGKTTPYWISVVCLAATSSLLHADQAQTQIPPLDWLPGRWCMNTETGSVEEVWLSEVGGQLIGMSRTVQHGKVVAFEFLRIESVNGVTQYIAQPGGSAATVFTASTVSENHLIVENPAHDFPQKIAYQREDDALIATISGPGDGGQEQSIDYSYQACKE